MTKMLQKFISYDTWQYSLKHTEFVKESSFIYTPFEDM